MSNESILEQRRQARFEKSLKDADLMLLHEKAVDALSDSNASDIRSRALAQVDKWEHDSLCNPRYVDLWRSVLKLPIAALRAAMLRDDAEGVALRQNSPFGFLKGHVYMENPVNDNPDLPVQFIKDTLQGVEEAKAGQVSEYIFNVKSCPESLMHRSLSGILKKFATLSPYVMKSGRGDKQRIAALSREISAEHLVINESLDGSLADGLDKWVQKEREKL